MTTARMRNFSVGDHGPAREAPDERVQRRLRREQRRRDHRDAGHGEELVLRRTDHVGG